MNDVLLIIPAYNEAGNLPRVIENIETQDFPMDYLIVSDGSTDGTIALCEEKHYNYVALPTNLGLAGCFQTGMQYAARRGYRYAVQFDGDGQHRAEDIRALYEKMQEGDYDIVLGGYVGSFLTPWLDTIRHLVAERNTFEDDGSFVKLCTYQTGAAAYGAAMDVMEGFLRTV